ncbi:hypothetical protein B0H13DRAFT_1916589 [Mycena leptocephala]|nr:hypothetical protein B0H13DRAFT_1916589 [Mycena leptocephala]
MAAPCLTLDPALESCPDYSSASFQLIRNFIVAGDPAAAPLTNAEAASQLSDAWNTERDAHKTTWDAEVQVDAAQAAEDAVARAAQSEAKRVAAEATAEAERVEAEKKKPKLGSFDSALVIPDFLGPRASNFAKKKLDAKEYVELWYWTKEG